MNQAAPTNQSVLRNQRQRCKDPDLDRCRRLCVGSDRPEASRAGEESLPNSTDSQYYDARESAHFKRV